MSEKKLRLATTESVLDRMPMRDLRRFLKWARGEPGRVVRSGERWRDIPLRPFYVSDDKVCLWDYTGALKRKDIAATPREIERAWTRRIEARRTARRARASRRNRERRAARKRGL